VVTRPYPKGFAKVIRFWARMFTAHLVAEIEYLRAQVEHERQRAEYAIDELLRVRVAVGPVTQVTPREAEQRETLVEKLLKDSEFTSVGDAE
jgi:hypothetical protein